MFSRKLRQKRKQQPFQVTLETLESRLLLAGDLVAHWQAEDLNASVADSEPIAVWTDSVQSIAADGEGNPTLLRGELSGRSLVRFQDSDGFDSFRVEDEFSPLRGADDFSVVVAFVTESQDLQGSDGPWFQNTAIVDSNNLGLSTGWGVSINRSGQIAVGMGAGFGQDPATLYSTIEKLNDGQLHVATFTRSGVEMALYVDDRSPDTRNDGSPLPRSESIDMRFGNSLSGILPFDGAIAEVRFYDGALSAVEVMNTHGQIQSYYNNQAPVAVDDSFSTAEDPGLFVVSSANGVLANDTDTEQDALTVTLIEDVRHGTLSMRDDGSFIYVPQKDFFGTDEFTYTANDGQSSNVARATINVLPEYDPAIANADRYTLRPTNVLSVDASNGVLANDLNPDLTGLISQLETDVDSGVLTLSRDGSFTYDPQGFAGTATFSYRIHDGVGLSPPTTVNLVVNTPPVATPDSFVLGEDTHLTIAAAEGVLQNDVDADGGMLSAELLEYPINGELEFGEDGAFVYSPDENYHGIDLFTYQITDGVEVSAAALVTLSVQPINDPPVAAEDAFFTLPGQLLEVAPENGVLANDADVEGDATSAVLVDGPTNGTLTLEPSGAFTYLPDAGFTGSDTFTYRANDAMDMSMDTLVTLVVGTIESLQQIVINEIHYDPNESGEPFEFLELHNRGGFAVDLSGWSIRRGISFVFPEGTAIGANDYIVVAQDPSAAQAQFQIDALGPWQGRLNNDGETIEIRTASGALIDEVRYKLGFPWPTVGDEKSHSIQLINSELDNDLGGSWRSAVPSPNEANEVTVENPPPHMRQVEHEPKAPQSDQPVTVTMKVTDADGVAGVELQYQVVEPGSYVRLTDAEYATNWTTLTMNDAGTAGDAVANDDTYSVVLSAELQKHRRLIRYRFNSTDSLDNSIRGPYDDDPVPNFAYFVYDGIPDWTAADRPGVTDPVTYGREVMNSLPAYHLIANETDIENSQYNTRFNNRRFNGSLVYDGIVYDHMEFKNRGQNSTYVTGKNKWKLFFHRGHEFEIRDDYGKKWKAPVRKLNLGTAASPWARPNRGLAGMDEALAFKFFNLAGVPAPNVSAFQLRVVDTAAETDPESQYNGDLWGLYLAFEDPGGRFLDEHDLPDGNLFRMQGGSGDLRHQGLGMPGNRSDLREFTSSRTGYIKRNPVQPLEWWRDNVDLDRYYSYRAVIEALNHSDLRDRENSLQFHNAETGKWTQLPWDLDLLYEEFDRWGPDGVQNASTLEQFRLSLQHDEINIEFQSRLREMQDLLFNADQAWQAVEEYARYVEPFAAIDRAMWDYHPRTSSIHRGYFYRSPAPYHGGAAGEVRRELTSPDFEGMVNWVKEFIVDGGFGGDQLRVLHTDADIPETPVITSLAGPDFPITDLRFSTTPFRDPQGADSFQSMQWRIGEVTDPTAPAHDPNAPVSYELKPVWQSGTLSTFSETILVDADQLRVGHAYRARVRMQDDTGRWSHWSAPIQFVPTVGDSDIVDFLRISEVHYHPANPTPEEIAAGFTNSDEFEFIEVVNVGPNTISLSGAQLITTIVDGNEEGVEFDFSTGQLTTLAPGERAVVVENLDAFAFRYGDQPTTAGQWSGRLNNAGETIVLAAFGEPYLQFRYDDAWHPATDGDGPSLEIINDTNPDLQSWSNRDSWRASSRIGGTPGLRSSSPGDANHDGVFDSADLVQVFQAAEYEDDTPGNSVWEEGDWNGDGDFTTSDLVVAFQTGGYVAASISTQRRFQLPVFADRTSERTKTFGTLASASSQTADQQPTTAHRMRNVELTDAVLTTFKT